MGRRGRQRLLWSRFLACIRLGHLLYAIRPGNAMCFLLLPRCIPKALLWTSQNTNLLLNLNGVLSKASSRLKIYSLRGEQTTYLVCDKLIEANANLPLLRGVRGVRQELGWLMLSAYENPPKGDSGHLGAQTSFLCLCSPPALLSTSKLQINAHRHPCYTNTSPIQSLKYTQSTNGLSSTSKNKRQ